MAKVLKELVFKAGEKNDGSAIWKKAGVLIETDYGKQVILLDRSFNPAGVMVDNPASSACLLNLFDQQSEEEREVHYRQYKERQKVRDTSAPSPTKPTKAPSPTKPAKSVKGHFRDMDDDIPF